MFLLNMEMKNQGGETLRKSSRSAMLRYKSELLHIISTTVFAPLMLYGLQEEKQVVTVELFSQYEEDPVSGERIEGLNEDWYLYVSLFSLYGSA